MRRTLFVLLIVLLATVWFTRIRPDSGENRTPMRAGTAPKLSAEQKLCSCAEALPKAPAESAPSDPDMDAFRTWLNDFSTTATPTNRTTLLEKGAVMARARHARMVELIETQPEVALKHALSFAERQRVPAELSGLMEKQISGRGDFCVTAATYENQASGPRYMRTLQQNGTRYKAFVYGKRADQGTQFDVPIHGVALDGRIALHESPVRVLSEAEAATVTVAANTRDATGAPLCPISNAVASRNVAVDIGGAVFFLCHGGHISQVETQANASIVLPSPSTEGTKKLLVIRVDFSTVAGEPLTYDKGTQLVNDMNTFYGRISYGKASFFSVGNGSAVTPVLRMPQSTSVYLADAWALMTDARAAAAAAGYSHTNYDYDVVCLAGIGYGWAGLGAVGARGAWVQNSFSGVGTMAHELGHNFGLWHANRWEAADGSALGVNSDTSDASEEGRNIEYGNPFDRMGGGGIFVGEFGSSSRAALNWLPLGNIHSVTNSGTYRIYALDSGTLLDAATQKQSLRVDAVTKQVTDDAPKDSKGTKSVKYWAEARTLFSNEFASNGVLIRWCGDIRATGNVRYDDSDYLLNTKGSTQPSASAPLVLGRTLSDPLSGVHLTTWSKNATTPISYDVVVNIGTFPNNRAPTVVLSGPTSVGLNSPVTFTANATDPDGDTLSYAWDFGDSTYPPNAASTTKTWTTTGTKTVTCIVSDMKGKVAQASMNVSVSATNSVIATVTASGNPSESGATGTFRIALSSAPSSQVTVNFAFAGSAANGQDYSLPTSLAIPAGQTSGTLALNPINDTSVESAETVVLTLANGGGYTVGSPGSATLTIADNDTQPPYVGTGTGLQGTYFNAMDFTSPVFSRLDATVDFDWGNGAPDPRIEADTFSIRWEGFIEAQYTETYTISPTTDDGVRVTINGTKIIDRWVDQAPSESSGTIALTRGQKVPVVLEYYENGGGALAQLRWSSPSTAKTIVPSTQLYPIGNRAPVFTSDVSAAPNPALVGQSVAFTAVASDADGDALALQWNFGDGTQGSGATTSHTYQAAGTYTATVTVSDGRGGSASASVVVTVANEGGGGGLPPSGLRINFQPTGTAVPAGYIPDNGLPFGDRGNGFTYGWNRNIAAETRDRNAPNSPDQRYDTLIHMQKGAPATWELQLGNGSYRVRVVCGDPSYFDSSYKVDAEGVSIVNATPTAAQKWFEGSRIVAVNDGRLTLSCSSGAQNNKVCFLEITPPQATEQEAAEVESVAQSLKVSSLRVKMNFGKSSRDGCAVAGTIPDLPADFSVKNLAATLDVGASMLSVTLDAKGRGKSRNGSLQLKHSTKGGWQFRASTKNGSCTEPWGDGGLTDTTVKNQSVDLPVTLTLGSQTFAGSKSLKYSAKEKRTGTAQ